VYVVSQPKLAQFLADNNLIGDYVQEMADPRAFRGSGGLGAYLRSKGLLNRDNVRRIADSVTITGAGRFRFMRDGKGRLLLPGSTIKGALRTATVYKILKDLKTTDADRFRGLVPDKVRAHLDGYNELTDHRDKEDARKEFSKGLVDILLGKEPHQDLFRAVRVSDVSLRCLTREEAVKLACKSSRGWYFSGSERMRGDGLRVECVPARTNGTFVLGLDDALMEKLASGIGRPVPFSGVEALLAIAREFAHDQWDHERTFWGAPVTGIATASLYSFYNATAEPFARVGWGTGMLGTTISLLLDEPLRKEIRNMTTPRGEEVAPKSRRVVVRSNAAQSPLGWLALDACDPL
jgi:CRISPR-associated protein Csm5